jgi:hypothetical protein
MKTNPVGWFEIPVTDMDRAVAFYENVFGFQLNRNQMGDLLMAWFPMEDGVYGSTGTLAQGEHYTPSTDGTVVYLHVDSIETALERIEKNGGKTIVPKTGIGEHGFIAHFLDCEGNRVALHAMT